MTKILDCSPIGISTAVDIVKNKGIVVYPTDTVYGIGCYPYYIESVNRIYEIKRRDRNKPLSVLASNIDDIRKLVYFEDLAFKLAEKFWPGALTIICRLKDVDFPKEVTSNSKSLAIRIPNNKCILSILNKCRYIIGTSANISGERSVDDHNQISSNLKGIDAIINDGSTLYKRESTIVSVENNNMKIIRVGAIQKSEIFDAIKN